MSTTISAYNKLGTDMTIVLEPRSALRLYTNIGTAWDEVRLGFYASIVDNTNPPQTFPTVGESFAPASINDRLLFGLKNSSNDAVVGDATAYFLGAHGNRTGDNTATYLSPGGWNVVNGGYEGAAWYQSTTAQAGTFQGTNYQMPLMGIVPGNSSSYCGRFAFRFVISNRGLSSQTFRAYGAGSTGPIAGTNYTAAQLRIDLGNASWTDITGSNIAWNNGAAAYPLPDAVWLQNPFYNTRLRISALDCWRAAPV